MTHERVVALLLTAAAIAILPGCSSGPVRDGAPRGGSATIPNLPDDAVPRPEAKSKYGNGPVYEVFGKQYNVMDSSHGYRERGVASWYGKKFHGNLTSNRETYDMYQMTAAHKTLPLPTYVEVTNLRNGRRVVVRVNDRGPFVDNRLIDLSYAAAVKLDMIGPGTSLVDVRVIDDAGLAQPAAARVAAEPDGYYVQVGAFSLADNARRARRNLEHGGLGEVLVQEGLRDGAPLYRVRVGPVASVEEFDALVSRLGALGYAEARLAVD